MAEFCAAALAADEVPPGPWVFIPTPGDHYSPATGSANITRIYRLVEQHVRAGGQASIIVGHDTRADTYPAGEVIRVVYPRPIKRWQRALDVALGHLHLARRTPSKFYARAAGALPPDFRGTVFVYNEPYSGSVIHQRCPHATVVLYLGNQIWRMYSSAEAKRSLRGVDHIVCVSQFLAEDLRQKGLAGEALVHVVHSGAELDAFSPRPVSEGNPDPVILFVGRTQAVKGPDLLIEAAHHLMVAGKRFKVRIVGSENFNSGTPITAYERQLRRAAEPLGDRVEFLPFTDREHIAAVFAGADIFCVPSRWEEPLGLVVLEGLAAGLPMVVARRGGIPEVAGDAALYFDPKDVTELVRQLGRFIDDAALRAQYGRLARAQAELWSWENQYQKLRCAVAQTRAMPSARNAGPVDCATTGATAAT